MRPLLISTIGAGSRAEWHVFSCSRRSWGKAMFCLFFEQGLNITRLSAMVQATRRVLPVQAAEMAFWQTSSNVEPSQLNILKGWRSENDEPNYEQKSAPVPKMPPFKAVTFSKLQFLARAARGTRDWMFAGVPSRRKF